MSEAVSFERLVAYYREDANLLVGGRPQRVAVGYAAGPLLETLGVAPRLGPQLHGGGAESRTARGAARA